MEPLPRQEFRGCVANGRPKRDIVEVVENPLGSGSTTGVLWLTRGGRPSSPHPLLLVFITVVFILMIGLAVLGILLSQQKCSEGE